MTRLRFPRMHPVIWLLLAVCYGAQGVVASWFMIQLLLPLAASKSGIIYYPAEDRIFVDNLFQHFECDEEHRLTDTIPMVAPATFDEIKAEMLYICDKPGEERKWIYTLDTEQEIFDALDHIERLALHRDSKILGGLGIMFGFPIVFCLAAAIANRKPKQ